MVRINLVAQAERRRLLEHEQQMASISGVEALAYSGKASQKARLMLITRVRSCGWTVGRAASAAGITERTAYMWLADGP